eukprot:472248_1
MLSKGFYRSTRVVQSKVLSFQIKHGRQLTPKLFHKQAKYHKPSYITKGSASTLAAYLSAGIVPHQWVCGFFGGAMIGGSSVLMLAIHGRIAGISGMATSVFNSVWVLNGKRTLATCSQFGFMAGILGSGIYWNWKNLHVNNRTGIQLPCVPRKIQPFQQMTYSPLIMALSGLLVGFGTRLGSGCTTGHGICGLGRKSIRSLTAVSSFFGVALVTATAMNKYYPELYKVESNKVFDYKILSKFSEYGLPIIVTAILCGAMYSGIRGIGNENILSLIPSTLCGFGLGTGLVYSGMTKPDKIRGFLDLNSKDFTKHFDPTLGFVFVGALAMSLPLYPLVLKYMRRPILSKVYHLPTISSIDMRLIVGSSLFGVGWGIGGICPGPGVVGTTSTEYGSLFYIWMLSFFLANRLVVLL